MTDEKRAEHIYEIKIRVRVNPKPFRAPEQLAQSLLADQKLRQRLQSVLDEWRPSLLRKDPNAKKDEDIIVVDDIIVSALER